MPDDQQLGKTAGQFVRYLDRCIAGTVVDEHHPEVAREFWQHLEELEHLGLEAGLHIADGQQGIKGTFQRHFLSREKGQNPRRC